MRARTSSRGSCSPASIMPWMAADTASDFIFMKSVSVLSRSKTIARIKRWIPGVSNSDRAAFAPRRSVKSLARRRDGAADADLAVVDAQIESAGRVVAHPGIVGDGRAVATVIGEWQQHAFVALHALGKTQFHPRPPPLVPASRADRRGR